jgi:uncharacterized protein (TIGR03067 family)
MCRIRVLGLVLACVTSGAFALADPPKSDAAQKELDRLRGKWTCTGVERDGKEDRSKQARAGAGYMKMTIRGDTVRFEVVILGEKVSQSGTIRIDPTTEPKRIDLTFDPGQEEAGQTFRGIYALAGDKLRILWPKDELERRPTTLRTREGDGSEIHLFERAK